MLRLHSTLFTNNNKMKVLQLRHISERHSLIDMCEQFAKSNIYQTMEKEFFNCCATHNVMNTYKTPKFNLHC